MYVTAYNPTDGPVVVTDQGHTIGGRSWGTLDTTSDAGRRALELGDVLEVEAESSDNADVSAALERTKAVSERAELAGNADKGKLLEAARNAGLVGDDEEPHKPELVAMLATRTDLELELGSTRKRTAAKATDTDPQEG